MEKLRPIALSIAGLDPSGGAGLLADIKTFEANKVLGFGIASANTFQNDNEFQKVDWIELEKIIEQIELLKKRYEIKFVKIGLIENLEILFKLIQHFKRTTNNEQLTTKIIWDPILKSSSGFEFHKKPDQQLLENICKDLYLITPNVPESIKLGHTEDALQNAKHLSKFCNVYLKGGHDEKKIGRDHLFTKDEKDFSFRSKGKNISEKHGSGCVLSSAITANLVKGNTLHRSCLKAKGYTTKFLSSNSTLLGYHK